jgi:hypothetical protein
MFKKILEEIKFDVDFVRSHQLQPGWYKLFKVILLLGVLIGYGFFFGWKKMLIFLAVFLLLSLAVHLLYRTKTEKFTRSWLDFKVVVEQGKPKPVSIGVVYYLLIFFNLVLSFLVSQAAIQ